MSFGHVLKTFFLLVIEYNRQSPLFKEVSSLILAFLSKFFLWWWSWQQHWQLQWQLKKLRSLWNIGNLVWHLFAPFYTRKVEQSDDGVIGVMVSVLTKFHSRLCKAKKMAHMSATPPLSFFPTSWIVDVSIQEDMLTIVQK